MEINKTCSGGYCRYRCLSGTAGFLCSYTGYCDYQTPRDSRENFALKVKGLDSNKIKKIICREFTPGDFEEAEACAAADKICQAYELGEI